MPVYLRFDADFRRPPAFFLPPLDFRFDGTFAPFFRASESPIAIACLRLVTFPPFPLRPLRSVPFFRRFIALSTRLLAAFPYFRVDVLRVLFFRVAMSPLSRAWRPVVHGSIDGACDRSKGRATRANFVRIACLNPGGHASFPRSVGGPPDDRRAAVSTARLPPVVPGVCMVDTSRARVRAFVVVGILLAAAGCSDSSTGAAARKIVGQVIVAPGDARVPAQRFVGAPGRAPLTPLLSRRAREASRINIVFRSDALGAGQLGAMSVRTISRAQSVATAMRARLAAHPASALFTVSDVSPTIGAARLRLRDPAMRDSLLRALRADPSIASVSIDRLLSRGAESKVRLSRAMVERARTAHASTTPGAEELTFATAEASFIQYWHYNLIDAPRAWGVPDTGAAAVTVAVIDDGINQHPDIVANLDMAGGYDFVSDDTDDFGGPVDRCGGGTPITNSDQDATPGPDSDPTMPVALTYDPNSNCFDVDDIANHGLHVAGTIGATNGAANVVSGINWNVRIRPIRALGVDGFGYDFDIAQAVLYAAGLPAAGAGGNPVVAPNRAPIINMSLGGGSDSTLGAAVAAAIGAGSVIIASAGNDASTTPSFPASYPDVISVAALGPDGELTSYTTANALVSLVAPGGDFRFGDVSNPFAFPTGGILSTVWDFTTGQADWAFYTGTSMAAPHVSGVAALVLAANPSLSGAQLRARLTSTAVDMGPPGFDTRYGYGRVDAYNAVTGQSSPPMQIYVRAIDAGTGAVAKTVQAESDNTYSLSGLAAGSYYVVAGQDENGDGIIGFPGRRYGWAGGAVPTAVTVSSAGAVNVSIPIGVPTQQVGVTGRVFVDSWVYGSSGTQSNDVSYGVTIPTAGIYSFETSGAIGSCGFAVELDTRLTVTDASNTVIGTNDNTSTNVMTFPGIRCSYLSVTLQPGSYLVQVTGGASFNPGTFRLHVRSGA